LLDHISRTGELPRSTVSTTGARYFSKPVRRLLGPGGGPEALARLYPTYEEMGAAAVLLICHEAWNLSVLQTMQLPDQWPNADADTAAPTIHRVDTDKPRRGPRLRHGSNNLVDLGEGQLRPGDLAGGGAHHAGPRHPGTPGHTEWESAAESPHQSIGRRQPLRRRHSRRARHQGVVGRR
jgi:hypothetical protein